MKKITFLLFFTVLLGYGQRPQIVEIQKLIDARNFISAETKATVLLEGNASDQDALEKLGDIAGHLKDWEKAEAYYSKLLALDAKNANYHYKYGGVLGMKALELPKLKALGLVDDIKKAFHTAADLDHQHIEARWALVEMYMQLPWVIGGSTKKALKYAGELEALSKVDGYLAKGYVYEYSKDPENAEKYYKLAVNVGQSVTCYQKLTNFYEGAGEAPEKAIATLETAYKKHERNAMHYQIGKVCAKYNLQLDKGEACLQTFIENHSVQDGVPIEWAYYRLAQIYRYKKEKAKATQWIDKALAERADFKQAKEERKRILAL